MHASLKEASLPASKPGVIVQLPPPKLQLIMQTSWHFLEEPERDALQAYLSDDLIGWYPHLPCAENVLCATKDNKVVGFIRFDLLAGVLEACGTVVHPDYRGKGIASRLWEYVLYHYPVDTVQVVTITEAGREFVRALAAKYPHVRFDTHFSPTRGHP